MATSDVLVVDAAVVTARLVEEGLIGLSPAADYFGTGRNGRRMHAATLTRYFRDGVRRADGTVVRLECVRVGSKFMTSKQAVLRFIAAQQEGGSGSAAVAPSGPNQPSRDQQRASAELDAALGSSD